MYILVFDRVRSQCALRHLGLASGVTLAPECAVSMLRPERERLTACRVVAYLMPGKGCVG